MSRADDDRILEQAKAIEAKRTIQYREQAAAIRARINGAGDPFKDDDLVYASAARCPCGAGMAYPADIGPGGSWYCSQFLKTRDAGKHQEPMPFAFFSIRAESQIARNNGLVTTRPVGAPWGRDMEETVARENERRRQYQPTAPLIDLATAHVVRPEPFPI